MIRLCRFVALLLALVLLVSGGAARGISYLCMMDGQVKAACCCKKADAPKQQEPARLERANRCCEVQYSEAVQAPALTDGRAEHDVLGPPLLAYVAQGLALPGARPRTLQALPWGARAPPPDTGQALFVLNCSYLI